MPTTPELDAALLAAAQALPAHFANAEELTVETLDAIQATTMSLPGGAFAVEATVQGAEGLGSVVLVITGLVDHKNGEVFDRTEARTLWTAALTDGLTAMQGEMGEFKSGQAHMTDPFDVLDNADEASVAGIFHEQTLAALVIGQPSETTGEGAAAELAAAIAAAEAELEPPAEEGADEESDETEGAEGEEGAESIDDSAEEAAADAPAAEAPVAPGAPGVGFDPAAGMPPGYEQFAGYAQGGYPPYGYPPPQQMTPEEAAAAQARLQANMNLPGMQTPPLAPFMPGVGHPMDPRRIDLLRDVIMGVSVELGRTRLSVQEILGLTPGSVVELDRAAGAPVDVLVNGTLIAHGEVVVVDEEFAVRISEVVNPHGGQGRATA
ncbi:MAG: flagellar motor switch protein FliN [Mobilicoccus sp.]|nr:flagellar motor switch protein FliN [Mobilicoccus sp.]